MEFKRYSKGNSLIMACDILVRNFAKQVKEQQCYGLIADETADISQVEQLSISFRTVDDESIPDEKVIGVYALDSRGRKPGPSSGL